MASRTCAPSFRSGPRWTARRPLDRARRAGWEAALPGDGPRLRRNHGPPVHDGGGIRGGRLRGAGVRLPELEQSGGEPRPARRRSAGQLGRLPGRCLRLCEELRRASIPAAARAVGQLSSAAATYHRRSPPSDPRNRSRGVGAYVPFNGFPSKVEGRSGGEARALLAAMIRDAVRGWFGRPPNMIPLVAGPGEVPVTTEADAAGRRYRHAVRGLALAQRDRSPRGLAAHTLWYRPGDAVSTGSRCRSSSASPSATARRPKAKTRPIARRGTHVASCGGDPGDQLRLLHGDRGAPPGRWPTRSRSSGSTWPGATMSTLRARRRGRRSDARAAERSGEVDPGPAALALFHRGRRRRRQHRADRAARRHNARPPSIGAGLRRGGVAGAGHRDGAGRGRAVARRAGEKRPRWTSCSAGSSMSHPACWPRAAGRGS